MIRLLSLGLPWNGFARPSPSSVAVREETHDRLLRVDNDSGIDPGTQREFGQLNEPRDSGFAQASKDGDVLPADELGTHNCLL